MPLTEADIKTLQALDYDPEKFSVSVDGEVRLSNLRGACFFLDKGRCKAYDHRPEGCRIYPIIYDERVHKFVLDPICPHHLEFSITKENKERLKRLLYRIDRDAGRRLRA